MYKKFKKKFPKVETDHHESDFYIKHSPEVWEWLEKNYEWFVNCSKFHSQIDGSLWIDIPFAFEPFWDKKLNREAIK